MYCVKGLKIPVMVENCIDSFGHKQASKQASKKQIYHTPVVGGSVSSSGGGKILPFLRCATFGCESTFLSSFLSIEGLLFGLSVLTIINFIEKTHIFFTNFKYKVYLY